MQQHSLASSRRKKGVEHAIAGGTGGIVAAIILQPFDLVKTRIQQNSGNAQGPTRFQFKTVPMMTTIVKEEGVGALWRGVNASVLRVGLGASLYFSLLQQLERALIFHFPDFVNNNTAVSSMLLGSTSRMIAATIENPITVVKARFESKTVNSYHQTGEAIYRVVFVERSRGIFRGLGWTLLRDVPFSGIYLAIYRQVKTTISQTNAGRISPMVDNFVSGGLAGALASLLTHPADVAKTKAQLQSSDPKFSLSRGNDSIMSSVSKGRIDFWFSGLWPRIYKRSLTSAIIWTIYEKLLLISDNLIKNL